MNAQLQPTGSAYFLTKETVAAERHTLSVLVDNEPGILARIAGLFSGAATTSRASRSQKSSTTRR